MLALSSGNKFDSFAEHFYGISNVDEAKEVIPPIRCWALANLSPSVYQQIYEYICSIRLTSELFFFFVFLPSRSFRSCAAITCIYGLAFSLLPTVITVIIMHI